MDDLSLRAFQFTALVLTSPWTYLVLFGLWCYLVGLWRGTALERRRWKREIARELDRVARATFRQGRQS